MIGEVLTFLIRQGFVPNEGSASDEELRYLQNLTIKLEASSIGEVGFNAGFSSRAFLEASPEVRVTSFDIGEHFYARPIKKFIDKKFPGRHTLILGDSKETIPRLAENRPELKFDLIFIDGAHDYETVKSDILNMRNFSTSRTAIVIDDLTSWLEWGKGPTKAWLEVIEKGIVIQEELLKDGKYVDRIEPPGERSWALGKYIL